MTQLAPKLNAVEILEAGDTRDFGDLLTFEAPLVRDGKPAGELVGLLVTVDLPEESKVKRETFEERFGTLAFRFDDSDSILVTGLSLYSAEKLEMDEAAGQVRVIAGGTGAYLGVRGQVTSARNKDGTYTHEFKLLR